MNFFRIRLFYCIFYICALESIFFLYDYFDSCFTRISVDVNALKLIKNCLSVMVIVCSCILGLQSIYLQYEPPNG